MPSALLLPGLSMSDPTPIFQSIVETIREPLIVLQSDLRVRMASRSFYRVFGGSPEDTEGTYLYHLGSGEWRIPTLRALLEEIIPTSAVVEDFEVTHDFDTIGRRTMLLNARKIAPRDGQPALVLLAIEDITERKQLEEERTRLIQELTRSNAELDRFGYVASHDLQEPLRMVSSFTQLLAKRYAGRLDEKADRYIQHAVEGVTRMQALINDLLAYSRVGTHGKDREPTGSEEAFRRAAANVAAATRDCGAVITHDPLPVVTADPTQLLQLFQNLLGNAIKFRREAVPVRIHVSARRAATEWIFSVRDNGIGIDPSYFDRVFVVFQRLHTRAEYPGTGIGLAICKKIVEHHGGRIWVQSPPGEGTTFFFSIPSAAEETCTMI